MSGNKTELAGQLGKQLLHSDLMKSFPPSQLGKKWQKVYSKLQKVLQVGLGHSLCCAGVILSLLGSDSKAILGCPMIQGAAMNYGGRFVTVDTFTAERSFPHKMN